MMASSSALGRRADRQLGAVVEQDPELVNVVDGLAGRSANACRRSCCRSCRRDCSGCASRDRGRTSGDAARPRLRSVSRMTPGCTRAMRFSKSISRMRFMYFVKSSTTATLQLWPARLVPAPRARIGAPNDRHDGDRRANVVFVSWNDDADGNLAVVRGVGRVQARGCRDRSAPRRGRLAEARDRARRPVRTCRWVCA